MNKTLYFVYWSGAFGIMLVYYLSKLAAMIVVKNSIPEDGEKEWENPIEPEKSKDARSTEQIERQYEEAKRRKDNLTETDHIDKAQKNI